MVEYWRVVKAIAKVRAIWVLSQGVIIPEPKQEQYPLCRVTTLLCLQIDMLRMLSMLFCTFKHEQAFDVTFVRHDHA